MAGIYLGVCLVLAFIAVVFEYGVTGLIAFVGIAVIYVCGAYFLEKLVYPEREKRPGEDHRKN
jgi:predicted membrane channel-forming protein YqfA (hemolysin III family)